MHRPPQKIYFPGSEVPRIIGHRGDSFYFPENTVSSFDSAFACSADGIETDLKLTRDGVPVIFHNRTLLTLDKSRSHILNRSLAELKKLDWRGIRNKKQYSKPLRVMTFADFLKRYCHFVKEPLKKCICLELKSRKHDRETGMQEKLAIAVISELRNSKVNIRTGNVKILRKQKKSTADFFFL